MHVIKTDNMKVPLKIFSEIGSIEDQCIEQMKKVASLPFLYKHVSLMPDGHFGIGASIGAVVPAMGYVIPSLVGVDIGCGMCAVKLPITEKPEQDTLKYIMNIIRKDIPLGFKKHSEKQPLSKMPRHGVSIRNLEYPVCNRELENAQKSLGTLGGGNHFIEIQYGSDGHVWIMVHSGSRNLGKQVADHYNKIAIGLNERYFSGVPKSWQLAFLPLDSEQGNDYIAEMEYCVAFARLNRKEMMSRVVSAFYAILGIKEDHDPAIDVAHNYARMENHYGSNVMVHRKGATSAKRDEIGIIPGSQGSMSYIVKGKGNSESFNSCSHGAGRKMGRKEAQRELNLQDEIENLDGKGIIHSIRNEGDLDEATGAYKDIEEVMDNQTDLVSPMIQLRPLAVLKG